MSGLLEELQDPKLTAGFQRLCGILPCKQYVNNTPVSRTTPEIKENGAYTSVNNISNAIANVLANGTVNATNATISQKGVAKSNGALNGSHSYESKHSNGYQNGYHPPNGCLNGYTNGSTNGHVDLKQRSCLSELENKNAVKPAQSTGGRESCIVTNKFLFYLFHFGAFLGNEAFYILFYPMMLWNIDGVLARRVCVFWGMFMYLGQATKDIVRWPRPASPPVYRLEERYALEYGMPSTHAMVAAGMPFSLLYLTIYRYDCCLMAGLVIALSWCTLVCLSRLYLGMHSVLDIIAGLIYVCLLLPVYLSIVEPMDNLLLSAWWAPLAIILVPLVALAYYPPLDRWSSARGDTSLIVGTATGVMLAYWFSNQCGLISAPLTPAPYEMATPTLSSLATSFVRLVLGALLLVLTRQIIKTASMTVTCWIQGLNKREEKTRQMLSVELPTKFVTYNCIALVCIIVAPQLFIYLGIERSSYFNEIY